MKRVRVQVFDIERMAGCSVESIVKRKMIASGDLSPRDVTLFNVSISRRDAASSSSEYIVEVEHGSERRPESVTE